jgi:Circularly permutated YpsA SLOG family
MMQSPNMFEKIISGGQTGADRAALDFAMAHGIPHGGWCPQGRRAEDGAISNRYNLRETPGVDYAQRTEWNVRDSDGTVIFSINPNLSGGSQKTAKFTMLYHKPLLHLVRSDNEDSAARLKRFILDHGIKFLNVAGPRQSEEPEIGDFVRGVLEHLLKLNTSV